VLFSETRLRTFITALAGREDVSTVYLLTDSPESYAEMCDALPRRLRTEMLYRGYLHFFRGLAGRGA
jgi:hypothetical protein